MIFVKVIPSKYQHFPWLKKKFTMTPFFYSKCLKLLNIHKARQKTQSFAHVHCFAHVYWISVGNYETDNVYNKICIVAIWILLMVSYRIYSGILYCFD